jgi:hypothetical protein
MDAPPILQRTHTYELTRTDLFIGQILATFYNKLVMGMLAALLLFAAFEGAIGPTPKEYPIAGRVIGVIIGVGLALILFCGLQLLVNAIMAFGRPHKGLLGSHTLVLNDEGLIERTEYNETLHRWKGLHKVRDTASYLYIYVAEMNYHLIPKRSFSSLAEQHNFLAEVRRRSTI